MRRIITGDLWLGVVLLYAGAILLVLGFLDLPYVIQGVTSAIGQACVTAGLVSLMFARWRRGQEESARSSMVTVLDLRQRDAMERLREAVRGGRGVRLALAGNTGSNSLGAAVLEWVRAGDVKPADVAVILEDPSISTDSVHLMRLHRAFSKAKVPVRLADAQLNTSVALTERFIFLSMPIEVSHSEAEAFTQAQTFVELLRFSKLGEAAEEAFAQVWAASRATT